MDPYEHYKMNKEMEKEERRGKWRMAHGVMEYVSVVIGVLLILLLLSVLLSLLSWLRQDMTSTFAFLTNRF